MNGQDPEKINEKIDIGDVWFELEGDAGRSVTCPARKQAKKARNIFTHSTRRRKTVTSQNYATCLRKANHANHKRRYLEDKSNVTGVAWIYD